MGDGFMQPCFISDQCSSLKHVASSCNCDADIVTGQLCTCQMQDCWLPALTRILLLSAGL